MKPEEATKMIYKVDKAQTAYHKRYAKYAPGDPDSKQIMIDSSMLGVRGTAEILAEIVQKRFGVQNGEIWLIYLQREMIELYKKKKDNQITVK